MKITWFAAMTFRIQISGRIVVTNIDGAPEGVDPVELAAGAQTVVSSPTPDLQDFDADNWRPRRPVRLIDEDKGDEGLSLFRLGAEGLVLDSRDEGLAIFDHAGSKTQWNRWADGAVVVLSGSTAQCLAHGTALLDVARPRLIALAVDDGDIDTAFAALAPRLGDTSLLVLDPGLAVEV